MSAKSRSSHFRAKLSQLLLQNAKGFTLIELLVVVVIVGILSAVAIPTFLSQIRRARTAEAQTGLAFISRGVEVFRLENTTYPTDYTKISPSQVSSTIFLDDEWSTKAPNYDLVKFTDISSKGIVIGTSADTANGSAQYVTVDDLPIECVLGIGEQVDQTQAGGAREIFSVDKGCNVNDTTGSVAGVDTWN